MVISDRNCKGLSIISSVPFGDGQEVITKLL